MSLEPFQAVAERHAVDVWRFCASQVGVEREDDCCEETMLAALEAYPTLRDPGAVRTWLLRLAARKALDAHRAAARDPVPDPEVDPGSADPTEPADSGVFCLVRRLPEKQRVAVSYRVVADLTYREIGALMDTTQAAARRNVHEALKTLRRRLEATKGDP
jgi:RNA polymerase sigma factor (sigma-70 family)